jgi:hypothetical protein
MVAVGMSCATAAKLRWCVHGADPAWWCMLLEGMRRGRSPPLFFVDISLTIAALTGSRPTAPHPTVSYYSS